ncbi:MAG: ABC transporter ATP-binding protein [Rhodobacteraceae bacterium]|nr:ABC transporter ATP-binding protein [Paracoccaceae bacterium]
MADKVMTITSASKLRGPTEVLSDINLSLQSGERAALLGHNGAGKTTLMKSILGLTGLSSGQIYVAGAQPGSAAARQATAYLPEAVSFHKSLTGREQLMLFARLSGTDVSDVAPLLDRVGLTDAADRRIGTWSKGMRQRLGMAQVMLGRPKLALLDEPTSGLDPVSRHELYAIIDELAGQGTAVLIASHTLSEVEARTDRIAILRQGVLVADDTLQALTSQAQLPIRVRVRSRTGDAERVAQSLGGKRINGASVELTCPADAKMQQLQRIAKLGDLIVDFEMTPPRLEDLYRHYSGEKLQ